MKLFISWSGEKSRIVAKALKELLSISMQSLDVFFSDTDIEKGEQWNKRLNDELASTHFGIVCLTKENLNSKWINFEAGALSKQVDSRLFILNIDVESSDVGSPLNFYQATRLNREDIYIMLSSINKAMTNPLESEKLKLIFSKCYPDFDITTKKILDIKNIDYSKKNNELIKKIQELTLENNNILRRMESIFPSIIEETDKVTKTDYQKKYDILFDKICVTCFNIKNLSEGLFNDIEENRVLVTFIDSMEELMRKDLYLKKRLYPIINSIKEKMISEQNTKLKR